MLENLTELLLPGLLLTAGVRGTRYAVPAALIADLTGFCMAALSVRLFFRGCLCTFPDFSAIIVKLMT